MDGQFGGPEAYGRKFSRHSIGGHSCKKNNKPEPSQPQLSGL
jgi:hypothetical protein